jgi:hypothetical protein
MNELKKTIREVRGTALLVALLVMGVLIALSLALSSLILGESRSTRQLIDAGRAYYAAESGIEQALYNLDTNLPGWEGKEANIGKSGEDAVFTYEVKNQCNSYPCFDEDYNTAMMEAKDFYDVLELNETVTIPLFTVVDVNGVPEIQVVENFTVEFFTNFSPKEDLIFDDASQLSGWDVLRWKIFGLRDTGNGFVTESIHDFTAVSAAHNIRTGEDFSSHAGLPSWFGSVKCDEGPHSAYRNSSIPCPYYTIKENVDLVEGLICNNTQARDFYLYESDKFQAKLPCFSIKDFLDRNDPERFPDTATGLNYLTLTNMMNPAMLNPDLYNNELRLDMSRIFFRVETYGDDTVREFASITADGFSGDSKQSLSVEIKRDSYMPVFNFSVYSTYGSQNEYYSEENSTKGDLSL